MTHMDSSTTPTDIEPRAAKGRKTKKTILRITRRRVKKKDEEEEKTKKKKKKTKKKKPISRVLPHLFNS